MARRLKSTPDVDEPGGRGKDTLPLPGPGVKSPHAHIRRAQRLLSMVAELHKQGFQLLRVMPFLHDIGTWRLYIGAKDWFSERNGAWIEDALDPRLARYTSADRNRYFGWRDATNDDARALAAKFISRFPEIAAAARGRDWEYVGWYVQMMGWAEVGHLPVVMAEHLAQSPAAMRYMPLLGMEDRKVLPTAPPGRWRRSR